MTSTAAPHPRSGHGAKSVARFCTDWSIGITTFYALRRRGLLATTKIGDRTLVTYDQEQEFAERLRAQK